MELLMLLFLVIWIPIGILCGAVAKSKHRSAAGWLLVGLITGIFGLIAIAGMPALTPPDPAEQAASRRAAAITACIVVGFLVAMYAAGWFLTTPPV